MWSYDVNKMQETKCKTRLIIKFSTNSFTRPHPDCCTLFHTTPFNPYIKYCNCITTGDTHCSTLVYSDTGIVAVTPHIIYIHTHAHTHTHTHTESTARSSTRYYLQLPGIQRELTLERTFRHGVGELISHSHVHTGKRLENVWTYTLYDWKFTKLVRPRFSLPPCILIDR